MTRTNSHPCRFGSTSSYIDHDLSRAYNIYISVINVSYICHMLPACMIYIYMCMYIYVCMYARLLKYLHDDIFVKLYFRIFLPTNREFSWDRLCRR